MEGAHEKPSLFFGGLQDPGEAQLSSKMVSWRLVSSCFAGITCVKQLGYPATSGCIMIGHLPKS